MSLNSVSSFNYRSMRLWVAQKYHLRTACQDFRSGSLIDLLKSFTDIQGFMVFRLSPLNWICSSCSRWYIVRRSRFLRNKYLEFSILDSAQPQLSDFIHSFIEYFGYMKPIEYNGSFGRLSSTPLIKAGDMSQDTEWHFQQRRYVQSDPRQILRLLLVLPSVTKMVLFSSRSTNNVT